MQKGVKGGPATGAHAAGAGSGCLLGGGEGVGGERVPGGALPGGVVGKVEVEIEVKDPHAKAAPLRNEKGVSSQSI